MKASVIIPVWNGREYLSDCLDALLAQDYPDFEIIAVDNASEDGSADFVEESYSTVRLIRNQGNLGFAGGCNVGLRAARGDMLALLNQDAVVRPGWLQVLAETLQDPGIGVVGCKILYADGQTIQHAGGWVEWPLGLAHHYGRHKPDGKQWSEPAAMEYVTGAAIAFRRDVLEEIGPLDEEFWPGYFEDADFCVRAREAGYEVRYEPEAEVLHRETTSLSIPEEISRAYQRGRLRFLLKHMPPGCFLREFVPAERRYQGPAIRGHESVAVRLAYLEAIPAAARLLPERWQADDRTVSQVIAALEDLRQRAWQEDWERVEESAVIGSELADRGSEVGSVSPLQEFEFQSAVPVVGPLIARLRSLWYSVAARWAIGDLIEQQEAINRQHGIYIRALRDRVAMLAEENSLLSRQLADLIGDNVARGEEDHAKRDCR
ncbi:MAG: glycosyltransferase family 2 protein [bacterium]